MTNRGRLQWRCRRGTKELDLIFKSFLINGLEDLDQAQLQCFENLLELQDPRLTAWLIAGEEPVAPFVELVDKIRNARHY